jgi:hypothetical protein
MKILQALGKGHCPSLQSVSLPDVDISRLLRYLGLGDTNVGGKGMRDIRDAVRYGYAGASVPRLASLKYVNFCHDKDYDELGPLVHKGLTFEL